MRGVWRKELVTRVSKSWMMIVFRSALAPAAGLVFQRVTANFE
jgi:hypothetical protein